MPVPTSLRRSSAPLVLAGLSLLFALPVVVVSFPPMVDYPQHLALAAVVRFYGDAARGFADTFVLRPWQPHGAFPLLVALLGRVMPLEWAGKLVVALAVAALAPAARLVQRRGAAAGGVDGGQGDWWPWALAVLACGYGYAFWFGFVGTLMGYPLFLAGVALADRVVAGEGGRRGVGALALLGVLLYTVHLQVLVLLVGAAGWLTLVRWGAGRGLRWRALLALAPGLAAALAALGWARFLVPVERLSALERAVRATEPAWNAPLAKLAQVTGLTFGVHRDHAELAVSLLLAVLVVAAVVLRTRGGGRPAAGWREALHRHRVAGLAAALFAVYLLLPEWAGGYLVAGRVAPLAVMVGLCALPPPRPSGRRLAGFLVAALFVFQLAVVSLDFLVVQREAAGIRRVLATAEPGRDLVGLVFEPASSRTPVFPVFAHFPAYYQVWKGGRVLVSQADFFHSVVDYRAGRDWGALPVLLSERNPQDFDVRRHGPLFDYVLVRGPRELLPELFADAPGELRVVSAGRWHLVSTAL